MKRWLSLSTAVPLAIVASAGGAALVALWLGLTFIQSAAYTQAEEASLTRLSQKQHILEAALRRGDAALVDELIAGLGGDRSVTWAALVDGEDRVVASTHRADIGQAIQQLTPERDLLLADARRTRGPALLPQEAHRRVLGAIALERLAPTLSAQLPGVLVVEHDVGPALRRAERSALWAMWVFAGLLLAGALGVSQAFARSITLRANRVLKAAGEIAAGRFEARTGLEADDELGRIGQAVDEMAVQLESKRQESVRSEQRYRAVFEQANEAIFVAAANGDYEDANRAALLLVGYSREELLARNIRDLVAPEDQVTQPLRLPELRAPLETKRHLLSRTGERIPVEISASPLADGRLLGVVRDLRARASADRLREQLAVSERLAVLGTLAASVGHELNNPLTWVLDSLGSAEALLEKAPAEQSGPVQKLLADAKDGATRIARIVADLRIFAQPEQADEARPVELSSVVRTATNLAGPALRGRASIVVQFAELPPVLAEERRLCQVMLNLLSNAVYAMPRDRRPEENRVQVTAHVSGAEVVLEVQDNGTGIPPEVLPRIFEPYFSTKPPAAGSGLGLAICRDIVTRFGGSIDALSVVGEGATFRIHLPIARQPGVLPEAGAPAPGPVPAGRLRVLVIDDEPLVVRALCRMIGGHEVTVATSAREGLEQCRLRTFDRIFCDLSMPGGGGEAFYEGLRAGQPALMERVVFVTGGAATAEAHEFLQATRQPVLYKPFDAASVRARLG